MTMARLDVMEEGGAKRCSLRLPWINGSERAARIVASLGLGMAAQAEEAMLAMPCEPMAPWMMAATRGFVAPMGHRDQVAMDQALVEGNLARAGLARLVNSVEVAVSGSYNVEDNGALQDPLELAVAALLLAGATLSDADGAPPALTLRETGSGLELEGMASDENSFKKAADAANERSDPLSPVDASAGARGPTLRLHPRLAMACAFAARLAGCAWTDPWIKMGGPSWMGAGRPSKGDAPSAILGIGDDRMGKRLAMDSAAPWQGKPGSPALEAAAWNPASKAGEGASRWEPKTLDEPLGLSVGVTVAIRWALSSGEGLAELGASTLAGLAREASEGAVAAVLESVMTEAGGREGVPKMLGAILARIASEEMEREMGPSGALFKARPRSL